MLTAEMWEIASKTGQAYFDALLGYLGQRLGMRLAFAAWAVDRNAHILRPITGWGDIDYRGGRSYRSA